MRYGVLGESDTTTVSVSGDSSGRVYTITGLLSISNYTVRVAAENSAGTGVYSTLLLQVTLGTTYTSNICERSLLITEANERDYLRTPS